MGETSAETGPFGTTTGDTNSIDKLVHVARNRKRTRRGRLHAAQRRLIWLPASTSDGAARLGRGTVSGERVERRLAAIMATDVAGYSRLIGLDEAGTLARLK